MTSTMRFDKWENSLGVPYSNIVQVVSKTFSDVTNTSVVQAYATVANGDLSITSKLPNSKFLVTIFAQGYVNNGDGGNIGINRTISGVTTRILGVDGSGGDSWMGINHSADTPTSHNTTRQQLDSPGVPAGTVITYNMLVGKWTGTGQVAVNWAGYSGGSTITIMEIAQ